MDRSAHILIYLFLLPFLLLISGCTKDSPSPKQKDNFIKFFGDAYYNETSDIIQINETYYILYNHTNDDDETSFYVQNLNEYGNTVARKQFFGEADKNLWGESLMALSDGRIAVVGYINSDDPSVDSLYTDIYLLLINQDLSKSFDTVYNDTMIEKGFQITQLDNEGLLIYGTRKNPDTELIQRFRIPLNSNLDIENPAQDGEISDERIGSILKLDNGEFLMAGNGRNFTSYEADIVYIDNEGKYKDNYFSGMDGFYNELLPISETEIMICGENFSGSIGNTDAYIALFSIEQREIIWEKDMGGTGEDAFYSLSLSLDGNVLVVGYETDNDGKVNISIKKLNTQGDLLNETYLGGSYSEKGYKIMSDETDENGFIICGTTERDESSKSVLIKTKL